MTATIPKGTRITGEDRDKLGAQLAKRYKEGASIRQLAEETGRSFGFINRLMHERAALDEVTIRGRGGARAARR